MVSVIIPVFNEEESLDELFKQLSSVLSAIDKQYEILFIDDGSTDSTLEILKDLSHKHSHIKIFSFRSNQGKAEGLQLGFSKAQGDIIVTLDADLQDSPSEIPKLIEHLKNGKDMVSGWRKERKDPAKKVLSSKLFNILVRILWGKKFHDHNTGLKVYTKGAAKSLRLYGGLHRFIPLLLYKQGFIIDEVAVVHNKRKYGKSKYGFSKLWKDLPDLFSMFFLSRYSKRPFHFFAVVGGILVFLGVITLGYLSILHFQGQAIGRRPLLIFSMVWVISGLQIFFTGFLADLIINLFHEMKERTNHTSDFSLKYTKE